VGMVGQDLSRYSTLHLPRLPHSLALATKSATSQHSGLLNRPSGSASTPVKALSYAPFILAMNIELDRNLDIQLQFAQKRLFPARPFFKLGV
jgi:hypothetical protein